MAGGSAYGFAKSCGSAYNTAKSIVDGTACFIAGTMVLTEDGEKPIEEIQAGDILVLSNGKYVTIEKVQHEILETPVSVLVHNKCLTCNEFQSANAGKGYTKKQMSIEWQIYKKADGIGTNNVVNPSSQHGNSLNYQGTTTYFWLV